MTVNIIPLALIAIMYIGAAVAATLDQSEPRARNGKRDRQ